MHLVRIILVVVVLRIVLLRTPGKKPRVCCVLLWLLRAVYLNNVNTDHGGLLPVLHAMCVICFLRLTGFHLINILLPSFLRCLVLRLLIALIAEVNPYVRTNIRLGSFPL